MANIIRYISAEDNRANISGQKFPRPFLPPGNEQHNLHSQEARCYADFSNPQRARLVQISDPRLRQLRAARLSPTEREIVSRGILEQLLYWAESQLES